MLSVDPGSVTPTGCVLAVTAPPSPAITLGCVARGATSGTSGIVRRIVSDTLYVLEQIDNQIITALPPGGAFSQNNAGPLTGETINWDNGATSTVSPFGDAQLTPGFGQWQYLEGDGKYANPLPADFSDTPFWDRQAKVAQEIICSGATGNFLKGDRCTTSAGGAFTVLLVSVIGSNLHLRIIRKSGTIAVGNTVTNTTRAGGGTIATVNADPPLGIYVPFCPVPNLGGLGTYYEHTPKGNGTDGGGGDVGIETRLMHAIDAHHAAIATAPQDRRWRFVPFSSFDPPEGPIDGILGGVTVQVVKCSGTFPATGTLVAGQTVTGPGSWSATVVGWHTGNKYLFVRKTNGATLGAGTLTLSGGATVTGTGAAFGWAKGSTHYNNWLAEVTAATTAPASEASNGALHAGSAIKWQGLVLMPWETELSVHSTALQCPFPTDAQVREAWVQWTTDIRTALGRADLPLTAWSHRPESQVGSVFVAPGVPYALFLREIIRGLPAWIAGLTVFDSLTLGCEMAPDGTNLWLRNHDYRDTLSIAAWRHLQFGQVTIPDGGGYTPLPVGIFLGQSNMTGFTNAGTAIAFDRDPDLWKHTGAVVLGVPSGFGLSTVDANLLMWNPVSFGLEAFAVDVNANGSWGTAQGTCGPEVPVMVRSAFRYSNSAVNSAKFAGFKFSVPGSAINMDVVDALACWDPGLGARPAIMTSCTVTVPSAGVGRFTAAPGTFDDELWVLNKSTVISGSALGVQGAGGNNTTPWNVTRVYACDPAGAWVEFQGTFAAEGPRSFTLTAGPPPILPELRRQWAGFIAACREHGYVPRPAFICWDQGESDLSHHEAYQAKLTALFAEFDALFGLRVKGEARIPIVIALTTTETSWTVNGESKEEGDVRITAMRNAQNAVAAARTAAGGPTKTFDTSDLPMDLLGTNVVRTSRLDNGLHRTGRGLVAEGFRFDKALFELGAVPAHPRGELAVDFGAVDGGTGTIDGADGGEDAPPPDEESAGGVDGPSVDGIPSAETTTSILDTIDAAIRDGGDVASYTVNGRTVVMRGLDELLAARRYYAAQASRRNGLRRTRVGFRR